MKRDYAKGLKEQMKELEAQRQAEKELAESELQRQVESARKAEEVSLLS